MKVLLLCMAFVAVSLAMPVAEDNLPEPDKPLAPEQVNLDAEKKPEIIEPKKIALPEPIEEKKPEEKPELKSQPEVIEEIKPEVSKPENDVAVKPIEPEAKSTAELPANPQPEVKAESVAEDKKEDNAAVVPEQKPEIANEAEPKPELKISQPEPKPVENDKKEEIPAKVVEEKIEPVFKSVIQDQIIDVVSAIKNPAAIADDVVDPIAINPISEPHAVITGKSAKTEEKKDEAPKSSEESKSAESVEVEKPKEVVPEPEAPIGKSSQSKIVDPIDSQRVIRDTVIEKSVPEVKSDAKVEAKPIEPVPIDSPRPEEKAAQPKPEIPAAAEERREVKETKPVEAVKDAKIDEVIKPEVKKPELPESPKPEEQKAKETVVEPKPNTQALSSAPKNSEESVESGEKKGESAETDSSEESGETPKF